MINFLILFGVVLLIAYLTNYFLSQSVFGYRWRIFVAPGVIFHELSHALACLITGAKIIKISFFDKDGGSVKHQKSPIPIIGPILISTAPLILGILAFYFLARQIRLQSDLDLKTIYLNLKSIFNTIDLTNWRNEVVIYLLLSIGVTITPSWQDLRNMLGSLVFVSAVFYLLLRFTPLNLSNFNFIFLKLSPVLNLVIFVLLCFLAISIILYLLTKLVFKNLPAGRQG